MSNSYDSQGFFGTGASGMFGSGGNAGSPQTGQGSIQELLNSYAKYMPNAASAVNAQQTPQAQGQEQAYAATMPGYDATSQALLAQYGPAAAQVGQTIANANALSGAGTNVNLLNGPGAQSADLASSLNKQLNQPYYGAITPASQGAASAIGAINLGGLSPGESSAVERSLNQSNVGTGNLGLLNPTNTISNALNFGGAFNNKIGLMNNATNAASNVANAAAGNAGFSPVGTALSTSQTNQGTSFANPTMGATTSPTTPFASLLGGSAMSGSSGVEQSYVPAQAQSAYQNSMLGNYSTAMGSTCCFIFLEATNGKLPWWVRHCRNFYYEKEPKVASGYKNMAKWLVPLMKQFSLVKWLVNLLMVKPITKYGGYLCRVDGYKHCNIYKPFKSFWFFIWRKVA